MDEELTRLRNRVNHSGHGAPLNESAPGRILGNSPDGQNSNVTRCAIVGQVAGFTIN